MRQQIVQNGDGTDLTPACLRENYAWFKAWVSRACDQPRRSIPLPLQAEPIQVFGDSSNQANCQQVSLVKRIWAKVKITGIIRP